MVTAIFLISFTVMTLAVLTATIATQCRRAQILGQDAQLRQLLNAGAVFAEAQLQSDSAGRFSVPLPDPLRQLGADLTVEIQPVTDEKTRAEIEASLPHHYLSQRLRFSRDADHWQITEAALDQ